MSFFQCKAADDIYWADIESYDAESAAVEYAEVADRDSGGEMFRDPMKDECNVVVRADDGTETTFRITFDYSKDFYANEVQTIESNPAPLAGVF